MSYRSGILPIMNKLPTDKRITVLSALADGVSVSATVRITGVSKPAVLKLLVDAGEACAEAHDRLVRSVKAKRVQADELWSFVFKKQKHTTEAEQACGMGDSWLWLATAAESKLIVSYLVGLRDGDCAKAFMGDLAARLACRVQLTTDGLAVYLDAVDKAFGRNVDYAQLVKEYEETMEENKRYSPAKCCGAKKNVIKGSPDPDHISTSYSERVNLTIRTHNRRFVRLGCTFSKKLENHIASTHLHVFSYNFLKVHRTLKVTPAMEAGITDRLWTMADVVALLDAWEERQAQKAAEEKAKSAKPSGMIPIRQRALSGQTNQS